ncbi:MAG: squalene/phytoene synthase family protein [Anaerolineae bacterium]|nr:squalene/phytoene synthase family protein [Anaerolineae bacterium]
MTTLQYQTWERILLSLAHEAKQSAIASVAIPVHDASLLDRAYAHCDAITAAHSHSFYMASALLPRAKRRAIRALYAFCRVSDDIVDCSNCARDAQLAAWRQRAMAMTPVSDDLVAVAWTDARHRYRIPHRYAEQLIDGVARDLRQKRYETFADLATYAYGVASTVGLMSMHIVGFAGAEAIPYAIKLGVALQTTNILRDVGEDWRAGRVYLPAQDLAAFDLDESDLAAGRVDDRWRAFMRFQIARNRRLYAEAWPGIAMLSRDGRFAVAAAGALYRAILSDIEAHDYDVFSRRAHLSAWGKLSKLPGIWWRSR